tara:strand:- start:2808 stop:3671 length:864 start_codon:yes stop_codon:yes gene_type:complete
MNLHSGINSAVIKKGLYIVATPIGNLGDMTYRAVEILRKSDLILCEDTRLSRKLLTTFNINVKLLSNHKFNEKKNIDKIIEILKSKKVISMISDAGTPSISDPGKILIESCIKNKIDIFPVPGASAVSAAISICGFSDKFYFNGFISDKESENKKNFSFLSSLNFSIIFFISAKKINKIIKLIKKYFIDRDIIICKEMTKFYEEYFRSSVENLEEFKNNLKGEITIIVSEKKNIKKDSRKLIESDKKKIKLLINKLTIKDIISIFSEEKDVSKKEIYNYCLSLKNEN